MDLSTFFKENPRTAIAFSGGVDSSYLLYAALQCKVDVTAYYVKSAFQPQFELDGANRLAELLGVCVEQIPVDVLNVPEISDNPSNRCYYCKKQIFSAIADAAQKDGYTLLLDGTNASDEEEDRPGMRALRELSVRSPLRECGLTKSEIRRLSREAGLFTWDKPAYACLATRISAGEEITAKKLLATEKAEGYLFALGFCDFRIRVKDDCAKIQLKECDFGKLIESRAKVLAELKKYYKSVTLDLEMRK